MPKSSISPTGRITTYYPNSALTALDNEQAIITQVIPASGLSSGRDFAFTVIFDITSGLTPPALTIRVKYGNQTSVLTGSSIAVAAGLGTSRRIKIKGTLSVALDNDQKQLLDCEIRQDGASLGLLLGQGMKPSYADFTVNSNSDQTFQITIQAAALLLAPSVTIIKATAGMI